MMNQDSKDWFNCLPDEIILMIFQWLPKVSLNWYSEGSLTQCGSVCKRWHRLTWDERLWTRLDFRAERFGVGVLGHILSRPIINLKLSQVWISYPPILPDEKAFDNEFSYKLMYLNLSFCTVSTISLALLFANCNRLRIVSMESMTIDDTVCEQLSRSEHLEVLNLTKATGFTIQGIECLLTFCLQLKELNLSWIGFSVAELNLICSSLPKGLSKLNLAGCRNTLNTTHIRKLVNCCPHLRELDLSEGTGLTNESIKYIITLNDLKFLSLTKCRGIQCSMLKKLSCLLSLQYLQILSTYEQSDLDELQKHLGNKVLLNKFLPDNRNYSKKRDHILCYYPRFYRRPDGVISIF